MMEISGRSAHALLVVEVLLLIGDRDDIGLDRALFAAHLAVLLAEQRVAEPVLVVLFGIVGTQVIQAPSAFGTVQRSVRRHVGAVENRVGFERAQQLVGIAGD